MTAPQADERFERVLHKLDPRGKLLRAWALEGGVSAQVTALEVERSDGHIQKLLVRQHGVIDLQHNPHIAADEFKLLGLLHSAGLVVPTPYCFDESCEVFPAPYVVIEYIEGATEFVPADLDDYLLQLAAHLARIHQIGCSRFDLSFLPQQAQRYTNKLSERPAQLDESLDEGHIRDVLEAAWPLPQQNSPVLLHGDYWPGNILWKDGQLVAIIDWEDAATGDPLADLGNTRLELLWAFGVDAMQRFTRHYQALTSVDFTNLPYWDLCAALRPIASMNQWGLDAASEQRTRERHRWFTAQAFEQLSAR